MTLRPGQEQWLLEIAEKDAGLTKEELAAFPALRPLIDDNGADGANIKKPFRELLISRSTYAGHRRNIANEIIQAAQDHNTKVALEILGANGGAFMSLVVGLDAANDVVKAFPRDMVKRHLRLGLLETFNALKVGDFPRADDLLDQMSIHHEIPELHNCSSEHDPELVCVLFVKAVYSDKSVSDSALNRLFAVMSDLPPEAALMQAVLYNVSVDLLIRKKQFAVAYEAARRSLHFYESAGEVGLGFYIRLFQTTIALWLGDLDGVESELQAARTTLSVFSGRTANDDLLLKNLDLIRLYETGEPDKIINHLVNSEDAIPFGELWPTMAEPILSYGRIALSASGSKSRALEWVQRWRLREWSSKQFEKLIAINEVLALQDMGYWQKADEYLAKIGESDHGDLRIAKLASALDRSPTSEKLALQLTEARKSTATTFRQRLTYTVMLAESAINRKLDREAARLLRDAFTETGAERFQQFWVEQRPRLERIMSNRQFRCELTRQPQLKKHLEGVVTSKICSIPSELTKQEFRVLLLLAEGQSNKIIANRLGVSLRTVKFHVGNLFEKASVRDRKAVVRQAVDKGWL